MYCTVLYCRPWWDVMEDYMLYFFVVMSTLDTNKYVDHVMYVDTAGMVTLPMTFLSNTPIDCTIHHSLWPTNFTNKGSHTLQ